MPFVGAPKVAISCPACGTEKMVPHAWRKRNKRAFCSKTCRAQTLTAERIASGIWQAQSLRATAAGHTPTAKAKRSKRLTGDGNPSWKGGVTYRNRKGNYVSVRYVRCPPEFQAMARADGYVIEHRLVMARIIGRPLIRTECVHHLDHDPLNNAPSNLELWPDNRSHKSGEHGRIVGGAANRLFPMDLAAL